MRREKLFALTSKEAESDVSCRSEELALRAGLVHSYGSGTFGFTSLGRRVLDNIESIIRQEMEDLGQEVTMNQLQTSEMWKRSGRWKNFEGDEFLSLKNRDGKDFTLAATHEEASVELVRKQIRSYRDLDLTIYQIGRKFRDDRARKGLVRAKEFVMKDAYSFHTSSDRLREKYDVFLESYRRIFDRLGLEYSVVAADNGGMGGSRSHEFIAESDVGSDTYWKCSNTDCDFGSKDSEISSCRDCGSKLLRVSGIEIGHCFELGARYSESMDLQFVNEKGDEQLVEMASYGIGVSRLVSAIIEQNNDSRGINWNRTVSAFDFAVIAARHEDEVKEKAREIHDYLQDSGFDVLLYDGERSTGEKFADSDLIGVRRRVIVGRNYLENGQIELEERDREKKEVGASELDKII